MTRILGISAYYHDSAVALIEGGRIVRAAQEERFSRKKNDAEFPSEALRFCMQRLSADDIDYVVFYEKPFLKFERLLETYMAFAPRGFTQFRRAIPIWVREKLFQKQLLRKSLREVLNTAEPPKLLFSGHHQSHAASAYFAGPYDEAAVLCMDGVGEWATTSAWLGGGGTLVPLWQINFPHSLGLLYSSFTELCGFKVNEGEYKLMGLAPYGEPVFADLIKEHLIDIKQDGSFRLNLDYFDYCTGIHMINSSLEGLFGIKARGEDEPIQSIHMNLAASIQRVTEEVVLKLASALKRETGAANLCLAGGVALNCVANGHLRRAGIFDNIWVQPASGDAGGAIGAALSAWHQYLGHEKESRFGDGMSASLLGPAYGANEVTALLDGEGLKYEQLSQDTLMPRVAGLLGAGKIVGWFQGRSEFGPRALGSRSILADPRLDDMQHHLNISIKFRESFRPFAPVVLEADVADYFESDLPSPYMSFVEQVGRDLCHEPLCRPIDQSVDQPFDQPGRELSGLDRVRERRSSLPAITHVDFSARVQTVNEHQNPLLFALLQAFKEQTGSSVLINTSFNVKDEPIVETPGDALNCFNKTQMDVLVLGDCLLMKEDQWVGES
ncbi:MAG: carbamoyltransferase [Candidatus Azotimanducaceae bacterium]|jgi:carbamoyltransferase